MPLLKDSEALDDIGFNVHQLFVGVSLITSVPVPEVLKLLAVHVLLLPLESVPMPLAWNCR